MIFTVETYRITKQQEKGKPSYRVTLYLESKEMNPCHTGDMIVRATTGHKWLCVGVHEEKVFIASTGHPPQDMVGSWGIDGHYKIEN